MSSGIGCNGRACPTFTNSALSERIKLPERLCRQVSCDLLVPKRHPVSSRILVFTVRCVNISFTLGTDLSIRPNFDSVTWISLFLWANDPFFLASSFNECPLLSGESSMKYTFFSTPFFERTLKTGLFCRWRENQEYTMK